MTVEIDRTQQPRLSEVLPGWRFVRDGKTRPGDKFWRPADRSWIPLVHGDMKCFTPVSLLDMPYVIRKVGFD